MNTYVLCPHAHNFILHKFVFVLHRWKTAGGLFWKMEIKILKYKAHQITANKCKSIVVVVEIIQKLTNHLPLSLSFNKSPFMGRYVLLRLPLVGPLSCCLDSIWLKYLPPVNK